MINRLDVRFDSVTFALVNKSDDEQNYHDKHENDDCS